MRTFVAPSMMDETGSRPTDYGRGRRCVRNRACEFFTEQDGPAKLGRYTTPTDGLALCLACQSAYFDQEKPLHEFAGVPRGAVRRPGSGQKVSYPLPGLEAARLSKGYSRSYLAKRARCGRCTVEKLEAGTVNASPKMVERMARALGTSPADLKGEIHSTEERRAS